MTTEGEAARARAGPSPSGFQLRGRPVTASKAARLRRVSDPSTPLNNPPAYTVGPETATAFAVAFTFGFQAVAVPVVVSIAASRFRAVEPTRANEPPT